MNLLKSIFLSIVILICATDLSAQSYRYETIDMRIFFGQDSSEFDMDYRDNAKRLADFNDRLNHLLADSTASVSYISISVLSHPDSDGTISASRSVGLRDFLSEYLNLSSGIFRMYSVTGDMEPGNMFHGPDTSIADVTCVLQKPVTEVLYVRDTVFVSVNDTEQIHDTVYVEHEKLKVADIFKFKNRFDFSDAGPERKDLISKTPVAAVRTNILAIPFLNFGIEVPVAKNWSVGADYYYPWIWRGRNMKTCNQLMALDIEGRYWFTDHDLPEDVRLLGHSVGLYAGAGYYDFERNWCGHQGEFFNVGVDYLYAMPLLRGRLHLEFELGIGYIHSKARPYDIIQDTGYIRNGVYEKINWFGPTRAQVSVVLPIYVTKEQWNVFWHKMNVFDDIRDWDWSKVLFFKKRN